MCLGNASCMCGPLDVLASWVVSYVASVSLKIERCERTDGLLAGSHRLALNIYNIRLHVAR